MRDAQRRCLMAFECLTICIRASNQSQFMAKLTLSKFESKNVRFWHFVAFEINWKNESDEDHVDCGSKNVEC